MKTRSYGLDWQRMHGGSAEQANQFADYISQDGPQKREDRQGYADSAWGYYRRDRGGAFRLMERAEAAFLS